MAALIALLALAAVAALLVRWVPRMMAEQRARVAPAHELLERYGRAHGLARGPAPERLFPPGLSTGLVDLPEAHGTRAGRRVAVLFAEGRREARNTFVAVVPGWPVRAAAFQLLPAQPRSALAERFVASKATGVPELDGRFALSGDEGAAMQLLGRPAVVAALARLSIPGAQLRYDVRPHQIAAEHLLVLTFPGWPADEATLEAALAVLELASAP